VARLRFVGRWIGVLFGTIAWLVVVPLVDLVRRTPRAAARPVRAIVGDAIASEQPKAAGPPKSFPARP